VSLLDFLTNLLFLSSCTIILISSGIGYYTLPALIYGKAKYVFCCEWNPHAVSALKYNLDQNGVREKASILVGDSREVMKDILIDTKFDRVSLGLLPSSEGGWKTAIQAIDLSKGGWLHIHGNVHSREKNQCVFWVISELSRIIDNSNLQEKEHIILCHHIERVKSFAPKIDHYVADIYLGPYLPPYLNNSIEMKDIYKGAILEDDFTVTECPNTVDPPSCALGGILKQEWMY